MVAASPLPALTIVEIDLDRIDESPTNPRRAFAAAALDELADDIRRRGVLQPVLVRPMGDRFELVFGARRFRACRLADRDTVPAMVRELGDEAVLEAQLVENAKRTDLHPLEEADAYRVLHEQHGHSIDELAAAVGKSASYVYQRLRFVALGPEAREAFLAGTLTPATALLVARVCNPKHQAKAVAEVLKQAGESWRVEEGGTLSRGAVGMIVRKYMLLLADAPFDRTRVDLVPAAGACTACPKRSGAQRELFEGDHDRSDHCLDPDCFASKKAAVVAEARAKAEAKGRTVLEPRAAKKLFDSYSGKLRTDGATYAQPSDEAPGGETWRKLLGKSTPVVVAIDPKGKAHELVDVKAAVEVAKEKGLKIKAPTTPTTSSGGAHDWKAENEKRERECARRRAVIEHVVAAAVAKASKAQIDGAFLRRFAADLLATGGDDVLRRRGWTAPTSTGWRVEPAPDLTARVAALADGELRGLFVEFALPGDVWNDREYSTELLALAKDHSLDVKKLAREAETGANAAPAEPGGARADGSGEDASPPAKKKPAAKKSRKS